MEGPHLPAPLQLLNKQEAHGTVTQTPPKAPQPLFFTPTVNSNTPTGGPWDWFSG